MKMFSGTSWLRATGLGFLMASLGFSFALATSGNRSSHEKSSDSRAISSNCERRPVSFVTETDLGIVVAGSQFTRQIIAQFGFKPYSFSFGDPGAPSTLEISESGTISGDIGKGDQTAPTVETFEVRVFDARSFFTTNKRFSLTAVPFIPSPAPLQFANVPSRTPSNSPIALPVAVANEPYSYTLQANGGTPPYTIQFFSDEDLFKLPPGLDFNPIEGTIFGKPVIPVFPAAQFKMLITDGRLTRVSQTFSIEVLPGTISSDFIATAGGFKLDFGREGRKDSLKLKMLLNKTDLSRSGIRKASDLEGIDFDMVFGGLTLPPQIVLQGGGDSEIPRKFDSRGKLKFPDPLSNVFQAEGTKLSYEVKLNPKTGLLTVNFKNINLIPILGASSKFFRDPIIAVKIRIGAPAASSDPTAEPDPTKPVVSFDKSDAIRFDYRRRGNIGVGSARDNNRRPPGGLFLVTKVQGTETLLPSPINTPKPQIDRIVLRVKGLMQAPNGQSIVFGPEDFVSVLFGEHCVGDFPASSFERSGSILQFINTDPRAADLHTLTIDNARGEFTVTTYGMDPKKLFDTDILEAGRAFKLPITLTIAPHETGTGMSIVPTFDGQSTVTIFRKGGKLRNR